MDIQQGDALLFQTNDDGDISVANGITEMTGGFETMVYLCLFGGNREDDGTQATKSLTWWGNVDEELVERRVISRTQNLLANIPAIPANLPRMQLATELDVEVFKTQKIASEVLVNVTIPRLNTIGIAIGIEARGQQSSFNFIENWQALAA